MTALNYLPVTPKPNPSVVYRAVPHRLAQATTAAMVLLIFMGGMVTSKNAGLSVPDWPNSFGYNMFTFPYSKWVGGIFFEHTHRLMGSLVGFLSLALTVTIWIVEPRKWVRWTVSTLLLTIIIQGILGGLRVTQLNLTLAIIHGCFAQACLCLSAFVAIVLSRRWFEPGDGPKSENVITPAAICVAIIYVQLIFGALMRHFGAGLAIPDWPTSYGQLIPSTGADQLATIDGQRAMLGLAPVTAGQIWLHFSHRTWAYVVAFSILILVTLTWQRQPRLRPIAATLVILLLAQFTLGVMTVLMRKPADVASTHVVIGATTLMTTFTLLVRSYRLKTAASSGIEAVREGALASA